MDTQHSERSDSRSTSDLFLIAHKVRGEPAFDVAIRFKCPICEPIRQGLDEAERGSIHCDECDEGQHWWVVATTGHRAYPYDHWAIKDLCQDLSYPGEPDFEYVIHALKNMPPDLPDHYQTAAAPGSGKIKDLFNQLGFQRATTPQVTRRI